MACFLDGVGSGLGHEDSIAYGRSNRPNLLDRCSLTPCASAAGACGAAARPTAESTRAAAPRTRPRQQQKLGLGAGRRTPGAQMPWVVGWWGGRGPARDVSACRTEGDLRVELRQLPGGGAAPTSVGEVARSGAGARRPLRDSP